MRRLIGLVKVLLVAAGSWLVLGVNAQWIAIGYLTLLPGDAWGWVLYGAGVVLAFVVPVVVWNRVRSGHAPSWFWRTVLVVSPVFFCGQFIVGGTPDWNPIPLIAGFGLCLSASVATWVLSRPSVTCAPGVVV